MSMTQSSSQYFDQVAGQWDALRSGYFGEGVRQAAIARAYLRPEMTVADVGAGTGFISAGPHVGNGHFGAQVGPGNGGLAHALTKITRAQGIPLPGHLVKILRG